MNLKKLSKILIPITLILSLTYCYNSNKASHNINKKDKIKTNISASENNYKKTHNNSIENTKSTNLLEDTLNYLTSAECDGRRYDTEGNKKTQDFIINKFEKIGLEKYDNSYSSSYSHPLVQFNKCEVILNNSYSFELDNDFQIISFNNDLIFLPITFNSDDTNDCIYISNSIKNLSSLHNKKNIKAILYTGNSNHRGLGISNTNSEQIILKISESMFETLQNTPDGNLKLKFEHFNSEIKDNNIVGKISGTNNHNAIVLTAHFDHIGSIKDKIWTGALDNASGTAVLLDTVSKIKKAYSSNKPNCDIIFCALNSEEAGLHGSKDFASKLSKEYKNIININLDSLGQKNSEILYIDDDNPQVNSEITNFLVDFFEENNYKISLRRDEYTSDHHSFIEGGVLSYNLTTLVPGENYKYLHTPEDTIEKLDIDYLNTLSIHIQDLLQNLINQNIFSNKEDLCPTEILDKEIEILNEEINKLDFGEYKFIEYKDEETKQEALRNYNKNYVTVFNSTMHTSNLDDINKLFNKSLNIPNELNTFEPTDINFTFFDNAAEEHHKDPIVFDKVYKYTDYSTELLYRLGFSFESLKYKENMDFDIWNYVKENEENSYNYHYNNKFQNFFYDGEKVIETNKAYYLLTKNDKPIGFLILRENNTSNYIVTIKFNNIDNISQNYDKLFSQIVDSKLIDTSLEWLGK